MLVLIFAASFSTLSIEQETEFEMVRTLLDEMKLPAKLRCSSVVDLNSNEVPGTGAHTFGVEVENETNLVRDETLLLLVNPNGMNPFPEGTAVVCSEPILEPPSESTRIKPQILVDVSTPSPIWLGV